MFGNYYTATQPVTYYTTQPISYAAPKKSRAEEAGELIGNLLAVGFFVAVFIWSVSRIKANNVPAQK